MDPNTQALLAQEREDFINHFTSAQLSYVVRNIIVQSVPQVRGEDDKKILISAGFNNRALNTASKIVDATFREQIKLSSDDMQNTDFFKSAAGFLKANAVVEADYRFDKVLDRLAGPEINSEDREAVGAVIATEFANMNYTCPGLANRVAEGFRAKFSFEQDDIINDIKENVNADIEEAKDKNVIVQTAIEDIHDAQQADQTKDDGLGPDASDTGLPADGGDGAAPPAGTDGAPEVTPAGDIAAAAGEVTPTPETAAADPSTASDDGIVDDFAPTEEEPAKDDTPPAATADDATKTADAAMQESQQAEQVAAEAIPVNPSVFKVGKLMGCAEMVERFVKIGGNIHDAVDSRLRALERASSSLIEESSKQAQFEKPDPKDIVQKPPIESAHALSDFKQVAKEALRLTDFYVGCMTEIGLTPRGIFRKKDSFAVESGREIVRRFIRKNKGVSPTPIFPKNLDQAREAAFDLIQLRQAKAAGENVNHESIMSRESALFTSIADFSESDVAKIQAIVQLGGIKVPNLFFSDFAQDVKMTVMEQQVTDKPETYKADLVEKTTAKLTEYFGRPLKDYEVDIIKAVNDGQEPYPLANLYEKFIVSVGRQEVAAAEPISSESMEFKARVYTTIAKSVERLNLAKGKDLDNLQSYLLTSSV
jgi:hypothetical protein